ncbi:MAG TPA: hypothetical protein VFJ59_11095, partial [Pseudolabrys sp.]|nr:hypothetical protein [Pseudolabrys sp.]
MTNLKAVRCNLITYNINSGDCVGDSGKSYRVNWRSRVRPGSAESYAFATICVVIASLARWGLGQLSEGILVFPTYYPAVLFATLVGGAGAG